MIRLIFTLALTVLWLPLIAQVDLRQLNRATPLDTFSYDYSFKAMRAEFAPMPERDSFFRMDGLEVVKLQQMHQGLPVYGCDVVDLYDGDTKLNRTGRYARIYALNLTPTLSKAQVLDRASDYFDLSNASAELWIYPARLRSYLVWFVKENAFGSNWQVLIDAHTGTIHDAYQGINEGTGIGVLGDHKSVESSLQNGSYVLDHTEHGVRRRTFTAANLEDETGILMSDADDNWDSSVQAAAVDAHYHVGLVLDFMREQLGLNSYDNQGAEILTTVNYGTDYNNAFWNGSHFVFGDADGITALPLTASLDMVGHEIGHAIISSTSELRNVGETGSLNESFADIIGLATEYFYQGEHFDWMIGEDYRTPGLEGDALRYFDDPRADGYSRDHRGNRYLIPNAAPPVRPNIGIPNLAFYLAAEGGMHPRPEYHWADDDIEVFGIGLEKALNIFYTAYTTLSTHAQFYDAQNACIAAAASLYGDAEVVAVTNAWAAVGYGEPIANGQLNGNITIPGFEFQRLEAEQTEWVRFLINVPAGATNLVVRTFDGAGDADLYLRYAAEPSETQYTQRDYTPGNQATLLEAQPAAGIWHVGLRGYTNFTDVKLIVDYDLPDATLPDNETLALTDLSGSEGSWQYYTVEVHTAGPMLIEMAGGTGDADLYVAFEREPSVQQWDYRPYKSGSDESVMIENALRGTWHIAINSYRDFEGVSLQVSYPE